MLAKRSYVPPQLRRFLRQGHTSAEDAGRIAAQAGRRTLVLSHLLPGDEPVPHGTWVAEARRHFSGEIVVGRERPVRAQPPTCARTKSMKRPRAGGTSPFSPSGQTRLVSQAGSVTRRRPSGSKASAWR